MGETGRLRWADVYREADLYKAAVHVYTKPLFAWRKALCTSTDGGTLYDFARRGLARLEKLHGRLAGGEFRFRPGVAWTRNFNGRSRTLYIWPWEERIVDVLLYRALVERLEPSFSPHAYAYRRGPYGVDVCQRRIARALRGGPRYVLKRDIADYFASVDHDLLRERLAEVVEPGDPLARLLEDRIAFPVRDRERAARGIPFGAAVACLFANLYLGPLDRALEAVPRTTFFRYADDLLVVAEDREAAVRASDAIDATLAALRLRDNPKHRRDLAFGGAEAAAPFERAGKVRHLGLEFRAGGGVGLSRDKFRKLRNLFRFAFRRRDRTFRRLSDPRKRAELAIELARGVLDRGVRNVAIIDYYLKHVNDEGQLRLLDRWLAEEVLHRAAGGGHRKGHWRLFSFAALREMGLPSLVHRRRLLAHGRIDSPFFVWKRDRASRGSGGTAARPPRDAAAFSSNPEAAANATLVGESGRL